MVKQHTLNYKDRSGLGGEEGNHPRVSDIDALGKYLSTEQRTKWIQDITGMSKAEAEEAAHLMNSYSEDLYDEIHDGSNEDANRIIDSIIHNPNAPVFTGVQYRGVFVSTYNLKNFSSLSPREYLDNIIKSGVWREPGASSFSADKSVARDFGGFDRSSRDSDSIAVMVTYKGGKSGLPFKHMSSLPREDEVLHSGRQMREGMSIVKHEYIQGKTGTELHIEVDDLKKGRGGRAKSKKK